MENSISIILKILNAHINSEKFVLDKEADVSKLMTLAKEQEIIGIVSHMLISCAEEPFKTELKQIIYYEFSQSIIKEEEKNNLEKLFIENNINYAFIKGMFINKFYPIPELRTMSDIDVLVEASTIQQVISMLEKIGYKKVDEIFNVYCMEKAGLFVEVHSAFVSNDFIVADGRDIVNNNLSKEKHFEILITHSAKHLLSCGCGIRMFLDIIFFAQNNKLDYVKIVEKMKEYELEKFYLIALEFIKIKFGIAINGIDNNTLSIQFVSELENYIFAGGIFGQEDKTLGEVKRANNKSIFKVLFSIVFPSNRAMKIYYPILEKKPYLLWHYYSKRIFTILKKGGNRKKLKGFLKNKNKAEHQRYIKQTLGLLK